jgi:hypothetical protein
LKIKKLRPVEIVAVSQCSGNSRGFFDPRIGAGQFGNGAMGSARWRGRYLEARGHIERTDDRDLMRPVGAQVD